MPQMPNHSVAGETIRLQSDFDRPLNIGATQDLSRTVAGNRLQLFLAQSDLCIIVRVFPSKTSTMYLLFYINHN